MVGLLWSEGGETVVEAATVAPNWFVTNAWIVVLLPMVSAVLTLAFGTRTPGRGSVYGIAAVGGSMLVSLGVLWHFVQGRGTVRARHLVVRDRSPAP